MMDEEMEGKPTTKKPINSWRDEYSSLSHKMMVS